MREDEGRQAFAVNGVSVSFVVFVCADVSRYSD
jgi:hypothetical protein